MPNARTTQSHFIGCPQLKPCKISSSNKFVPPDAKDVTQATDSDANPRQQANKSLKTQATPSPKSNGKSLSLLIAAFAAWTILYGWLPDLSSLLVQLAGLSLKSRFGAAVSFFALEVPKVLMLLVLVVFAVGVLRSFFTPETTRRIHLHFRQGEVRAVVGIIRARRDQLDRVGPEDCKVAEILIPHGNGPRS